MVLTSITNIEQKVRKMECKETNQLGCVCCCIGCRKKLQTSWGTTVSFMIDMTSSIDPQHKLATDYRIAKRQPNANQIHASDKFEQADMNLSSALHM